MFDTYNKLEGGQHSSRSPKRGLVSTLRSLSQGLIRRWLVLVCIVILFLIGTTLYQHSFIRRPFATQAPAPAPAPNPPPQNPYDAVEDIAAAPFTLYKQRQPYVKLSHEEQLSKLQKAQSVVQFFTPPDFRPQCASLPALDARFHSLASSQSNTTIFFALNLVNSQNILPTFIHEITSTIMFMGPHRFHVHIWENDSTDKTAGLLVALSKAFDELGVSYKIVYQGKTLQLDKSNGRRIFELIKVRNGAMQPLYDGEAARFMGIEKFDLVVFMNDIVWCVSDLLEIIYEHQVQGADFTCSTDWGGQVLYDRWVARTIQGQPWYHQQDLLDYFNKPEWGPRGPLPPYPQPLVDEPSSRAKFIALEPMQVFSCWNGAAVMNPAAFFPAESPLYPTSRPEKGMKEYTKEAVRFRQAKNDQSEITEKASECYLICVDFWRRGLGRILLVPKAAVAYDLLQYYDIRQDGLRNVPHPISIEPVTHYKAQEPKPVEWITEPPKEVSHHDWALWFATERWGPWDAE